MSATVKAVIAVVAAAAGLAWALWLRELPVAFAVVVALAFGVLAFMVLRTIDRLRSQVRRPPPRD